MEAGYAFRPSIFPYTKESQYPPKCQYVYHENMVCYYLRIAILYMVGNLYRPVFV